MYHRPYFKDRDDESVYRFIQDHPFATLIVQERSGYPAVTHLPLLIDQREDGFYLLGHIVRQTDHHRAIERHSSVLVVFHGPQTYVSASWYRDPHVGSTWNYMVAHVQGTASFMHEDDFIAYMRRFTLHFEEGNEQSPTIFDHLSHAYVQTYMKAIVGLAIKIERMDHVFKLSQNRDLDSYDNIIDQLSSQGGQGASIADEMRKRRPILFGDQVTRTP